MRRIIFINRYFYPDISATSQILSDLVFELPKENFEVHVITSRLKYNEVGAILKNKEKLNNIHVTRVWTSNFGRNKLILRSIDYLTFYISSIITLFRITMKNSIVIAKTDPPLISVLALFVAKYKQAVLVNWLQDLFPEVPQKLGI